MWRMLDELQLFIEGAFIAFNRQFCETVCVIIPETLRKCVSVKGKHFGHFRR
jgi:hypothetical protein